MKYRELGRTGLAVSEIGFGAEWMERHNAEEVSAIVRYAEDKGINILDCWMSNPEVRTNLGKAIEGRRDKWIIQGHIGSTWQNGQYVKSRETGKVKEAFEDLLRRFQTDYIDLGMIHFVDELSEFRRITEGEFYEYVLKLKKKGAIRHIGMSTHNPQVARAAAERGLVEMILFSVNPAFDMLPASEDLNEYFRDSYDESIGGITKERAELYRICEENGIGITVMKGYEGGRLLDASSSPFGVALTPVQCIHYALTRPAVASVLVGYDSVAHVDKACRYEKASNDEKDYATVLANAPRHAYSGLCTYCGHCTPCPSGIDIAMVNKLYDLAAMHSEIPDTLRAHYNSLSANGKDCISCKACERRCPFGVHVAERMKAAEKLFS